MSSCVKNSFFQLKFFHTHDDDCGDGAVCSAAFYYIYIGTSGSLFTVMRIYLYKIT